MEALTAEDLAILDLESPTIAGHTCKVAVLDGGRGGPPTIEEVRAHVASRLPRVPRCSQRLALGPVPSWTDPEPIAIDQHVRPAPGGVLDVAVAQAMTSRLDRGRPLWDLGVVPDAGSGQWAVIWRVHHAMADGMTMMRWASDLLWDEPPADPPIVPHAPAGSIGASDTSATRSDAAGAARSGLLPAMGSVARTALSLGRELRPVPRPGPFGGHVGRRRQAAFAHCTLEDLRAIEHSAGRGVTINDVILAAVAGALRHWCVRHGTRLEGARVKVPVSMHVAGPTAGDTANRDSFMFVDLPLREPDPVARLRAVNRETRERKTRHDAEAVYDVLDALERVAPPLATVATRLLMNPREFTLNVSNVPGPRSGVRVLGREVRNLYSFAEVAERHPVRIAAVSLGHAMQFGILADPDLVPGAGALAVGIEGSIAELLAA
ncbi:MAG: DUF1298 domain-containing protein [Acidimicrobiia bacterium]|nr:DUF1298 domain-containing protein [Acidimicrobiia bacterium]